MFGVLSFRGYLIIAVVIGAVCAATAYFDTSDAFASFFFEIGDNATRHGFPRVISDLIVNPIGFAFSDIYWAIAAGVFWPLLAIWFFLFFVLLGYSIIGPTVSELETISHTFTDKA